MSLKATADFKELRQAAAAAKGAVPRVLGSLLKRAVALTREEFPYARFRRGIKPELAAGENPPRADVVAEFILKREPTTGTLHLPGGATLRVALRGSQPFNVLEAVETGTGLYGPKGRVIKPRAARALLIAAESVKAGEAYITAPGGPYVLRRESEGTRPDDYPGRAVVRLEGELDGLVNRELEAAGL